MILIFLYPSSSLAIRCSNDLISEDESKFEVILTLKKCGTILAQEELRSSDTNLKVDKWLVRILEMGGHYCYELTFADAILIDIELIGKCN